jgi:Holliday junction resolvase RusA-like endonuclease
MQVIFGSNHIEIDVWELDQSYRPKYMTADLDNLLKSVGDALNGVAFRDDKQLHHVTVFFTKDNVEEPNNEQA